MNVSNSGVKFWVKMLEPSDCLMEMNVFTPATIKRYHKRLKEKRNEPA